MMAARFRDWLVRKGHPGAATIYPTAINQISAHYLSQIGERIDVYAIRERSKIDELVRSYGPGGRFEEKGDERHGLYRAAIRKYQQFFIEVYGGDSSGYSSENSGEALRDRDVPESGQKSERLELVEQLASLVTGHNVEKALNTIANVLLLNRLDTEIEHLQKQGCSEHVQAKVRAMQKRKQDAQRALFGDDE